MATNSLIDALRQHRLLDSKQLDDLNSLTPADSKALAKELIQRNWLTPYQANQLLTGKGQELILGSYILLERLGEGGMGQVFKARHRNLGRIAAIKLIRKDRLDNPTAVKRFQREVRAASALAHPNIVLLYDADEIAGTHLMVMEYIEGAIDLAKLVKKNGPPPVERACEYIRQAALGLQHAFERGMVHRDIKPANLLLTAGGKTVKVLDMGLARLDQPSDEEDDKSSTMTQEGAVMGTPDYIAPEQALDTHTVDIRADVYSLGCTFYYLLAGRVPFPGGTLLQKLNKHQNEQPLPIEKLRPEVPAAVAKVVRKMMAKKPDDRYQTPAEVALALAAVHGSLTGIVATPLASEATVAWNPAAAPPAAASTGGSLSSALDYIAKRSDTVAFVPEGTPTKPKSRRWLIVALGTGMSALLGLAILVLLIPRGGNQGPIDGPKKLVKNGDGPIDGKVGDKKEFAKDKTTPGEKTPAPTNWSLDFAENGRVDLPALALKLDEPLTAEAWVTPRRPSGIVFRGGWIQLDITGGTTGKWPSDKDRWHIWMPDGGTGRNFWSDQEVSRGKRTHLAAVWTGKEIHFYVNGQLQSQHDTVTVPKEGHRLFFLGEKFQGQIHQFRVSKAARYKGPPFSASERFESDDKTLILYRFEEGQGDILKDSSGKNNHGTIVGAKWVKVDGSPIAPSVPRFGLRYDGKAEVEVPNLVLPKQGPLCMEAYVTLSAPAPGGNNAILLGSVNQFHLFMNTKEVGLFLRDVNFHKAATPNLLPPGKRFHIAGVKSDTDIRLYIDGKLAAKSPNPERNLQVAKAMMRIGFAPFEGILEEVRISKVARYDKDFTPAQRFEPDADTLALYHCDEAAGDVLKDSSGNGHDGKIVGAKWVKADGSPIPTVAPANFALQFDGVKSYVEVPTLKLLPSAGPFTAEAWVRMKSTGRFGVILQSVGPNDEFQIAWHQPQLGWCAQVAQPKLMSVSYDVKTKATGLVHLAAIWDGKRPQLFVNGLLIQHQDASAQWLTDNFGVSPRFLIGVGMKRKDMGNWFAGTIDEIRISKIARYTKDFTPAKRFEPDADTLALYHFDEAAGDVLKDSSGNGHDGKIVGAKWVKADGTPIAPPASHDYALRFNGKDAAVEVPSLRFDGSHPITIEAWVRPKGVPEKRVNAHVIAGWGAVYMLAINSTSTVALAFEPDAKSGTATRWSYNVVKPDDWQRPQHLAAVWDGKTMRAFVDGRSGSAKELAAIRNAVKGTGVRADHFAIGCDIAISTGRDREKGSFFEGIIDEVRISKIARYDKDFTPQKRFEPDADTLALYHFDEGSGDVLKDSSGNGHHGKIVGAKWVKADGTPLAAPDSSFYNGKDLTGWTVADGTWRVENGEIVGTHGNQNGWNRLRLDRTVPKDFELTFEALSANAAESQSTLDFRIVGDSGVALRLAEMPGRLFLLARGAAGPLLYAAPKQTDLNAYQKIHLRVVGKRITVTVNGTVLTDQEHKDLPDGDRLAWVLAPKSPELRIRNIQFIDLSKSAAVPTIDLLPLIDPAKDAVKGAWKFNEKGDLVCDEAQFARIRIPYRPPAEYDMLVSFTKLSGPEGPSQILVGGGRQFRLKFGGYGNLWSYFDLVDGKGGRENRTAKVKTAWVTTGLRHESRVEVRKDSVKAYLDRVLATELLQTDFKNVNIHGSWDVNEAGVLGLVSNESPTAFHKVQVVEISGPGTFTRPNDPAAKKAAEQRKIANAPGPWRPLLDKDLTHFRQAAKNQPKAIWVDMIANESVLRVKGEGRPYVYSQLQLHNSHLRLEFQTPTNGFSEFNVGYGWPGGKSLITFDIPSDGKARVWNNGMKTNAAALERGVIVTKGKPNPVNTGFNLADASLEPAGQWNRFDLVRVDDRIAFFVNGRFLGAVADLRGMVDNKEFDLGKATIQIHGAGDRGESLIRRIEVRDISAFQPDMIEPGPWEALLPAKDLSKWGKIDRGQADAFKFVEPDVEPVLALRKLPKEAYLWSHKTMQSNHVRMDFKFPAKEPAHLQFAYVNTEAGLFFHLTQQGTVWAGANKAKLDPGTLEHGAISARRDQALKGVTANLEPAGAWNRLDLVRVDNAVAIFINGRFVSAFTGIRTVLDGKEIDFGKTSFNLDCQSGEVWVRDVQIRDISALPPELLAPPFPFDAKKAQE